MTRKDYVVIARAISLVVADAEENPGLNDYDLGTCRRIAENIAIVMAYDNPKFDRLKFLTACGVE